MTNAEMLITITKLQENARDNHHELRALGNLLIKKEIFYKQGRISHGYSRVLKAVPNSIRLLIETVENSRVYEIDLGKIVLLKIITPP